MTTMDFKDMKIADLEQNVRMLEANLKEASKDYHFYNEIIGQQETEISSLQDALVERDLELIYLSMLEEGIIISEEGRKQLVRQFLLEEFPTLVW